MLGYKTIVTVFMCVLDFTGQQVTRSLRKPQQGMVQVLQGVIFGHESKSKFSNYTRTRPACKAFQ